MDNRSYMVFCVPMDKTDNNTCMSGKISSCVLGFCCRLKRGFLPSNPLLLFSNQFDYSPFPNMVSRIVILNWLNSMNIPISRIEDIGKGVILCKLMSILHSEFVDVGNVKDNPRSEMEYIYNINLVKEYFKRLNVVVHIPADKMCKLKMQDNLEVIQWFYKYFTETVKQNTLRAGVPDRSAVENVTQNNCSLEQEIEDFFTNEPKEPENYPANGRLKTGEDLSIEANINGFDGKKDVCDENSSRYPSISAQIYSDIENTLERLSIDEEVSTALDTCIEPYQLCDSCDETNTVVGVRTDGGSNKHSVRIRDSFKSTDGPMEIQSSSLLSDETYPQSYKTEACCGCQGTIDELIRTKELIEKDVVHIKKISKIFEAERNFYYEKLLLIEKVIKNTTSTSEVKRRIEDILYSD